MTLRLPLHPSRRTGRGYGGYKSGFKHIKSSNSKYWPETNLLSEFFDDYTDLLSDLRWRVAHGYAVQTFDLVGAASDDSQKAFQRRHSVLSGLQSRADELQEEQEKQNDLQWIWLITERLVKVLGRDPEQAYKEARAAVDEYWDQNPGADRSSRHRITIK